MNRVLSFWDQKWFVFAYTSLYIAAIWPDCKLLTSQLDIPKTDNSKNGIQCIRNSADLGLKVHWTVDMKIMQQYNKGILAEQ